MFWYGRYTGLWSSSSLALHGFIANCSRSFLASPYSHQHQKHCCSTVKFRYGFKKIKIFAKSKQSNKNLLEDDFSPVHVVLVSLLVNQLFGLFLIFFGRPKKNCPVSGNFWSVSGNFWYTKKKFGRPKKSEPDQKFPETEQIFFGRPKKREK